MYKTLLLGVLKFPYAWLASGCSGSGCSGSGFSGSGTSGCGSSGCSLETGPICASALIVPEATKKVKVRHIVLVSKRAEGTEGLNGLTQSSQSTSDAEVLDLGFHLCRSDVSVFGDEVGNEACDVGCSLW